MCFSAQPNAQVRQPNVNRFSVVVRRREAPVRSGSGSRKHSKASVHWVRGAAMLSSHEPSRRERHNSHPSMPACQDAPRRRSPTCSLRDRSIAHLGRSLRGRGRLSAPCNHRIPLKRLSVERRRRREHQFLLCAAPKGAVFSSVARSGPPTVDLAAERAPSDGRFSLRASGASHPLVCPVTRVAVDEEGSIARTSNFRRLAFVI